MTTNALQKRAVGLVELVGSLQIENGQIIQTEDFVGAVGLASELQTMLDEFWKTLKQRMQEEKVTSAKGEWGYLSLNEVRSRAVP